MRPVPETMRLRGRDHDVRGSFAVASTMHRAVGGAEEAVLLDIDGGAVGYVDAAGRAWRFAPCGPELAFDPHVGVN